MKRHIVACILQHGASADELRFWDGVMNMIVTTATLYHTIIRRDRIHFTHKCNYSIQGTRIPRFNTKRTLQRYSICDEIAAYISSIFTRTLHPGSSVGSCRSGCQVLYSICFTVN